MVLGPGSPVLNLHCRIPGSTELYKQRPARVIGANGEARIDIFAIPVVFGPVADVGHFGGEGARQRPLVSDVPRVQPPVVTRLEQNVVKALRQQRPRGREDAVVWNRRERGRRYPGRQ